MRKIVSFVSQLLFPPFCCFCHRRKESEHHYFCHYCNETILMSFLDETEVDVIRCFDKNPPLTFICQQMKKGFYFSFFSYLASFMLLRLLSLDKHTVWEISSYTFMIKNKQDKVFNRLLTKQFNKIILPYCHKNNAQHLWIAETYLEKDFSKKGIVLSLY